jgi:hypothetical protein
MIVLCANCHGRKGNGPGQIDRKSLRVYKSNLGILNSRYGEFERRALDRLAIERNADRQIVEEEFGGLPYKDDDELRRAYLERSRASVDDWDDVREAMAIQRFEYARIKRDSPANTVFISAGMELSIWYLRLDGYLVLRRNIFPAGATIGGIPLSQEYVLTPSGEAFVDAWSSAMTIETLGE